MECHSTAYPKSLNACAYSSHWSTMATRILLQYRTVMNPQHPKEAAAKTNWPPTLSKVDHFPRFYPSAKTHAVPIPVIVVRFTKIASRSFPVELAASSVMRKAFESTVATLPSLSETRIMNDLDTRNNDAVTHACLPLLIALWKANLLIVISLSRSSSSTGISKHSDSNLNTSGLG